MTDKKQSIEQIKLDFADIILDTRKELLQEKQKGLIWHQIVIEIIEITGLEDPEREELMTELTRLVNNQKE